uniref:NAD(P)H-binding protein n=1 Tax=Galactobacter sp. TaxID=2676125 RepID=UPI0025BBC42C
MDRMNYPTGREEHLAAVTGPTGKPPTVLVLGATGYIGGRLTPRLLKAGYRVRILARSPARVRAFPWGEECDVVKGDVLDPVSVRAAMDSVSMIYYLVHSLASGRDFEQTDLCAAHVVAHAAARAGVGRIIYLGGLHPERTRLSSHLRSRRDVGQVFLDCTVPALVLQAGVIIGSGSASFEMIRHLTEVLPYMPAPKWVRNRIQPIAVRDVMHYLLGAARVPKEIDQAVDIGGPDVLTYAQMMNGYAEAAGLPRRFIVALPVLTPGLASHWVGLVTPVPRSIARPLVASLENECIMHSTEINGIIPPPPQGLTPYLESIRLALGRVQKDLVETSWQDVAVLGAPSAPLPSDPDWAGRTVYVDQRRMNTTATVEQLWSVISGGGGLNGWYS